MCHSQDELSGLNIRFTQIIDLTTIQIDFSRNAAYPRQWLLERVSGLFAGHLDLFLPKGWTGTGEERNWKIAGVN